MTHRLFAAELKITLTKFFKYGFMISESAPVGGKRFSFKPTYFCNTFFAFVKDICALGLRYD